MTEQVDLDALIAEARGFADWWHEDPQNSDLIYGIHRTGDAPGGKRVMEKREVSATSLRALADALESTLAELRQERAKVRGLGFSLEGTQAALSRAEETIEKAIACEEHTHRIMTDRKPTREDSSLVWRILTDYDEQQGADRG